MVQRAQRAQNERKRTGISAKIRNGTSFAESNMTASTDILRPLTVVPRLTKICAGWHWPHLRRDCATSAPGLAACL
jgi:hypothetical protein